MNPDGADHLKGERESQVEASIDRYFVEFTQYYSDSRYDRGNGMATSRARLHFDFITGTYELAIQAGTIPSTYGGKRMQVGSGITEWGPSEGRTHTPIPIAVAPWGAQKFPESGQTIKGSWTWEQQLAAMEATGANFNREEWSKREPTQGKLSWILEPDDPVDEEWIVEVDDYENWLPAAGANEETPGNKVGIKATVVAEGDGTPQHLAVMFRLAFEEVSREPGVALNQPLIGAKTSPDLIFDASENPDGWIVLPDGLGMQKVGARMTSASGKISCRDWGAYGIVHVWATLENGKVLRGKLRGSESVDVRLPQRSAVSQISDAWKRRTQFAGDDTDDLDEQIGNTNEGDGLTAYEEYRRLIVDRAHTRATDALAVKRKDLIVANDIGATRRAGLALFERASGIHVVELKPEELPASRMVNLNRGTAGENRPAALLGKTPKMSQEAVIDVDDAPTFFAAQSAAARAAGETMPSTQEQYMSNTIAHEVAHGVRTPHHGRSTEYFGPRALTVAMRDYRAFGSDGKPLLATEGNPVPSMVRSGGQATMPVATRGADPQPTSHLAHSRIRSGRAAASPL